MRSLVMVRFILSVMLILASAGSSAIETGKLILASPEQITALDTAVARTPEEWRDGFKEFEAFSEENGFLMIFPGERVFVFSTHGNKRSPDIILINKYSRVIQIFQDAKPDRYYASPQPILGAVNVTSGFCERHGIRIGTGVQLNAASLKPRESRDDFSEEIVFASAKLRDNIESHPDDPDQYEALAEFYLAGEMSEDAEEIFRDLLTRKETPYRLNSLGRILAGQRKYDEAVQCFRRAFKLDSGYEISYRNAVQVLSIQGNIDGAIEFLRAAIEMHPENMNLQLDLARIYIGQNDFKRAGEMSINLNKSHGSDPEVLKLQGDLYVRDGQFRLAAQSYLGYLKLRPYDPRAAEYRAFVTVHMIRKLQLDGEGEDGVHE